MAIQFFRHLQGYAILRCDIYVHLGVDPSQLQYTILTKSQRCRPCDSNAATTAQAARPAPSPSCSGGHDSSAARPAWPRLLRVATTTTARPRALPRPVSFVQRRRRQLSRAPCPAPSPSCSGGDDNSAARPAPPHLLRVARTTTAQPRAPPCPVSFVWRGRRQLSRAPCPVSFVWRGRRQLSHTPRPAPSPSCGDDDVSSAPRPAPSPSCGEDDDSSATRPAPPHLLRAAAATTAQPR